MKKLSMLSASAVVAASLSTAPLLADEVTFEFGVDFTTDYVFEGVSQTGGDAALQRPLRKYAQRPSGSPPHD